MADVPTPAGLSPGASPTLDSLKLATRNGELKLHYQPKVCLLQGKVIGAEALVRWEGTEHGVLGPDEFLPLAVNSGMLHDITIGLLDQVVSACARLRDVQPGLSISMNVAPDDLASQTISQRIRELLDGGELFAHELQIEITETAVMRNVERVRDDLERLRDLGIQLQMDDFGTGWSSIDRLSQLPFSALKLDQGMVRRMGTSRQNLNTVRAAISMARELRMRSVAEGVESEGTYNFLIASGCEQAQGYFIGKPMPVDQFMHFVADPPHFAGSQIGWVHQSVDNLIHIRKLVVDAVICERLGPESSLPSVRDPELSPTVEQSRLGAWYFGAGQALRERAAFIALEDPLRRHHAAVQRCLERGTAGTTRASLDEAIAAMDACTDELIARLHELERELLSDMLERPQT